MRHVVPAMFIIVGIIHLLPLSGVLDSARLAQLYGITVDEPNIEILMRHRAVMFGILGALFILAAFSPGIQVFAFAAGLVSVVSFLVLASSVGGYNSQIGRIFAADIVALACLVVGIAAYFYTRMRI